MDVLVPVSRGAVRIFLVDDYPLFRAGIRFALRDMRSMEIVGEANADKDVIGILSEFDPLPDVVVAAVDQPDRSGIEVTREISEHLGWGPQRPRVLLISSCEDDESVVTALRAGANGYLSKDTHPDELRRAIETVATGGAVFSPQVATRFSAYFSAMHELPSRVAFPQLTDREREILDLLARGHDNRRIARTLVLSEKTVRNHVSRVFMKLRVTKRVEAVLRARDAGLGR